MAISRSSDIQLTPQPGQPAIKRSMKLIQATCELAGYEILDHSFLPNAVIAARTYGPRNDGPYVSISTYWDSEGRVVAFLYQGNANFKKPDALQTFHFDDNNRLVKVEENRIDEDGNLELTKTTIYEYIGSSNQFTEKTV